MLGFCSIRRVTSFENRSRSTASAPPASTRQVCAACIVIELIRRISSFKSPAALSMRSALRELEQMSSAKSGFLCAGEKEAGFISYKSTLTPRFTAAFAASHPANPPPITVKRMRTPPNVISVGNGLDRSARAQPADRIRY
ncbi:hypothetical protein SDC9_173494 [bioreactor metagenome]|uniref:Uncharacterized protein n=1 Tax=bioreactor metagenome TaxID=1076179 RepID=A0A645GJL2_9ZZZZ